MGQRTLRFALAGHPAPVWLGSGDDLDAGLGTIPVGINQKLDCQSGALTDDMCLLGVRAA